MRKPGAGGDKLLEICVRAMPGQGRAIGVGVPSSPTGNVIVEVPPCKLAQGIEYPCTSHGIDPGVGGKAQQTGNKLVNLLMAASVKVACH